MLSGRSGQLLLQRPVNSLQLEQDRTLQLQQWGQRHTKNRLQGAAGSFAS
ncbi:hypothetical protein B2K_39775 [Paenibacillus mucilaginosus K02]|uniref:Uncharacterized protein n=1 Tax=Paenibacillus mucilaginosus K02 TaxID=997761 RepID=R9ULR4_9BACL|nr:hypothetical protein B2K_39775 [Paenibacillus mucilaginosus K02]